MAAESNRIVGGKRVAVLKIMKEFPAVAFDKVSFGIDRFCDLIDQTQN